jgi:hypothetical protein
VQTASYVNHGDFGAHSYVPHQHCGARQLDLAIIGRLVDVRVICDIGGRGAFGSHRQPRSQTVAGGRSEVGSFGGARPLYLSSEHTMAFSVSITLVPAWSCFACGLRSVGLALVGVITPMQLSVQQASCRGCVALREASARAPRATSHPGRVSAWLSSGRPVRCLPRRVQIGMTYCAPWTGMGYGRCWSRPLNAPAVRTRTATRTIRARRSPRSLAAAGLRWTQPA